LPDAPLAAGRRTLEKPVNTALKIEPERLLCSKTLASSKTMAQDVARWLRHGIVTMLIPPGTMLSEQDIGRRLGISRQPVREAFIKLAETGLLAILPQRGTRVVPISPAAVENARFIREAVECAVAREAAERLEPDCEALIAGNLDRQREAAAAESGDDYFRLDEEFHNLLARAAGRPKAWDVIEDVKVQMDRVRWLSMKCVQRLDISQKQHEAVFVCLRRHDPDGAAEAMRAHLEDSFATLKMVRERNPELFEAAAAAL
jgi:DNA-binding GntR family transcriptional regulator